MPEPIRGDPDDSLRMMLGQIRRIFDPRWIQALNENKKFTIQFESRPWGFEDQLLNFAEMYGYELYKRRNGTWYGYYFR